MNILLGLIIAAVIIAVFWSISGTGKNMKNETKKS